jgi:hypothetical protein
LEVVKRPGSPHRPDEGRSHALGVQGRARGGGRGCASVDCARRAGGCCT